MSQGREVECRPRQPRPSQHHASPYPHPYPQQQTQHHPHPQQYHQQYHHQHYPRHQHPPQQPPPAGLAPAAPFGRPFNSPPTPHPSKQLQQQQQQQHHQQHQQYQQQQRQQQPPVSPLMPATNYPAQRSDASSSAATSPARPLPPSLSIPNPRSQLSPSPVSAAASSPSLSHEPFTSPVSLSSVSSSSSNTVQAGPTPDPVTTTTSSAAASTSASAFPVPPTTTSPITDRSLNQSPDTLPNPAIADLLAGSSQPRGPSATMSKSATYDQLRKASDPPRPATAATMASASPSPSLSSRPGVAAAVGQRSMPRTSSIDSAISSISSASHSHKSSVDANNLTPADIASLIATAGSPEAVIIHLLKEKQHAASQNAQLWRLVDKQRTMVLGLNKDLERAVKEKDRYRKKLKELQDAPPPLPTGATPAEVVEEDASSSKDTRGPRAKALSDASSLDDTAIFPSPLHVTHSHSDPSLVKRDSPRSDPSSPTDSFAQPSGSNQRDPRAKQRSQTSRSADGRPANDVVQKPVDDTLPASLHPAASEFPKPVPPPIRRPPPAPLNLSQTDRINALPQGGSLAAAGSDSDYDDTLEVDEIPKFDRGRRKTREEDDLQREAILIQEQAARSQSSKKKTKQVLPTEGVKKSQSQGFTGMSPSGARGMIAHSPPAGLTSQVSPLESLASMLSPPGSETGSSDKDRHVVSPPMSPGLPLSPRPGDRPMGSPLPRMPKDGAPLASPPLSPRNGLPLSPRAPKYPNGYYWESPDDRPAAGREVSPLPKSGPSPTELSRPEIPTFDASVKIDSPTTPSSFQSRIYRGLVSDEYPDLLLPPSALPSIDVKVSSSRLRPSRNSYLALKPSEEEPVFTLSIFSRANRAELWRVEKIIMALPQLDQQLRLVSNFTGRLPDRAIFSGHSPAKVDARRAALNAYFESILEMQTDEAASLVVCQFLTADAIEPRDDETSLINGENKAKSSIPLGPDGKPKIEGYLTKRGKNFGGWKARYFVLHGPELKYYESPGGPHMGTIKIRHAQIGKQSHSGNSNQSPSRPDDDSDNQYRHAFLILEPKKKDSTALVRHVLCAESDDERDSWVDALLSYVENDSSDEENTKGGNHNQNHIHNHNHNHNQNQNQNQNHHVHHSQPAKAEAPAKSRLISSSSRKNSKGTDSPETVEPTEILRSFSYDDVVAAEAPIRGPPGSKLPPTRSTTQPEHGHLAAHQPAYENGPLSPGFKNISGPTNGVKIQDAGAWGNKTPTVTSTKEKKRSIWGFRAATTADLANQIQSHEANNSAMDRRDVRAVFGLPLAEAVEFCGIPGVNSGLPAVVYRCIEYLRAKDAASEEGIFRLSGSNVVIKSLKEKFNTEGDLDFLEGDHYYDVHAVASLFKQYLRELPTTVLTRELHLDFIRVLDLNEKPKKIAAFNVLVHRLPKPNLTLLIALSRYLIEIVNNSDINKMTVRNVGIVFAPTLNIPAPVFAMFLTDFDSIFGKPINDSPNRPVELTVDRTLTPEDIRSPRHQMFTDLPTPSYNQASFPSHKSDMSDSQRDIREKYDTGFIPMQPTYEQHVLGSEPPAHRQGEHAAQQQQHYNSMGNMLAPGNMQSKSKRRESNLLFMGIGNRKSGMPRSKDDQSMVSEDSAFD